MSARSKWVILAVASVLFVFISLLVLSSFSQKGPRVYDFRKISDIEGLATNTTVLSKADPRMERVEVAIDRRAVVLVENERIEGDIESLQCLRQDGDIKSVSIMLNKMNVNHRK